MSSRLRWNRSAVLRWTSFLEIHFAFEVFGFVAQARADGSLDLICSISDLRFLFPDSQVLLQAEGNAMATIMIKRVTNQLVFDPPDLILGNNDFVIWANHDPAPDPEGRHLPTLKGEPNQGNAKDWWMADSLPPAQSGQPAATSPAVAFGARQSQASTIKYVCAFHPGEEATITVPMSTNIAIDAGNPASYNPSLLTILTASNETVTFANNDTANAHQPFPQDQSPTTWMSSPIPAKTSNKVSKAAVSSAQFTRTHQDQSITYNCALHSGEQGVIVIPKI